MEEQKNKRGKVGLAAFLLADVLLIGAAAYMIVMRQQDIPAGVSLSSTAAATTETWMAETEAASTEPEESVPLELTDEIDSRFAYVWNVTEDRVLAEKNGQERMYPASMTKLMTLLLACESGIAMDTPYVFDKDMLDPLIAQGASRVGFEPEETVTFADLLYGSILSSGGDATAALAEVVDGDEASFAKHMNRRAQDLGMFDTHFVNASGLHDDEHYSTARDIALLLEKTLENATCREILSTSVYTTSRNSVHPNGMEIRSVVELRMQDYQPEQVKFQGGKTGFTDQAGYCLASFAEQGSDTYIVVVAGGEERMHPHRIPRSFMICCAALRSKTRSRIDPDKQTGQRESDPRDTEQKEPGTKHIMMNEWMRKSYEQTF